MARIGTNVTVAVQTALATGATTVSAVTKADPGVATATGHGFSNGDTVVFTVANGMVELDGQAVLVTGVASGVFTLKGLDTSDYSTFTSGSAKDVTTFSTIASAQNVSMPDPSPNKIDTTTLIDKTKQYTYGLADAPDGTITGLYDPNTTAVSQIKASTKANTALVFKISWAGGQTTLFNANVSGGSGFDLQQNQAATATVNFTPIKDVMDYA